MVALNFTADAMLLLDSRMVASEVGMVTCGCTHFTEDVQDLSEKPKKWK